MKKKNEEKLLVLPISSELGLNSLIDAASRFEELQIFDSDSIASEDHLRLAFFHAWEAFKESSNLAKSLKMEFLLRAAATGQIKVALERCGVKNPKKAVLVAWGENENRILAALNAKKAKWKADRNHLVSLYGLDKKRDLEKQIIEKMVEVQIED